MKTLSELRDEVNLNTTLDDKVEAIIYKSGQMKVPKSQAFIQQTFYALHKECPELLDGFIFDESGITPFSDELDSALFRLEASNVLHTLNPAYKDYHIEDSVDVLKKSYDKFQKMSSEIDRCAKMFSELVESQVKAE